MQIAEAQKEIQSNLSNKALEYLRNRKKAGSRATPADTSRPEVEKILPSQKAQKSSLMPQQGQKDAAANLHSSVRGRRLKGEEPWIF